jgi:hypothetical protein
MESCQSLAVRTSIAKFISNLGCVFIISVWIQVMVILIYVFSCKEIFYVLYCYQGGTWHCWLRHCATSQKVMGSIPDVAEILHWQNPSSCTMVLRSNQPVAEISTRNISWGVKVASALDWQPYHLHVSNVMKSGSLNLLEPSWLSRPVQRLLYIFIYIVIWIQPLPCQNCSCNLNCNPQNFVTHHFIKLLYGLSDLPLIVICLF